jgi:hypothetical protein
VVRISRVVPSNRRTLSAHTTLGKSVTNDALLHQTETFLTAISYAGIMDWDYRFASEMDNASFWSLMRASERGLASSWTTMDSMSRERSIVT